MFTVVELKIYFTNSLRTTIIKFVVRWKLYSFVLFLCSFFFARSLWYTNSNKSYENIHDIFALYYWNVRDCFASDKVNKMKLSGAMKTTQFSVYCNSDFHTWFTHTYQNTYGDCYCIQIDSRATWNPTCLFDQEEEKTLFMFIYNSLFEIHILRFTRSK